MHNKLNHKKIKSRIFFAFSGKMASNRKSKAELEREKVIQNRLQELLTRMLQDEDNKYCVDCDAKGNKFFGSLHICSTLDFQVNFVFI